MQSTQTPLLPSRVVREAIVNAAMHRSYRVQGPVQIIRYANRIEIRNPGHSLKAEEQLGEPGSETRNPKIAAVLHETNLAETKGSGIRVMRQLMESSNLLPPTFESSRADDSFVATFLFHHFLDQADFAWLGGLTDKALSDEEARALVFVRELGAIDNAVYRDVNKVDTLDASGHLRRLRALGLLEKKGSGNRTYYVGSAGFVASLTGGTGQSHKVTPQKHKAEAQRHKADAQKHKVIDDDHPPEEDVLPDDLPRELVDRLPPPRRRLPQTELRDLIVDLCHHQPLSSRNLARLLGDRDYWALVLAHLTPLVQEGRLAFEIPEMPQHPSQRYIAVMQ